MYIFLLALMDVTWSQVFIALVFCDLAESKTSTLPLWVVGGDKKEVSTLSQLSMDPRNTVLGRASCLYKRQTRPLVWEGAPQKQYRNCQTIINIWSWATKTYRMTISCNVTFSLTLTSVVQWLWLALSRGPNRVGVFPHLRMVTDPVSFPIILQFQAL
jgi:hypothetical protein